MKAEMITWAAINKSQKETHLMRSKMMTLKAKLSSAINEIDDCAKIEYTSWFALLKRDGDKWICVKCVNPDDEKGQEMDSELPEFDLMMPIAEPSTLPDFQGF